MENQKFSPSLGEFNIKELVSAIAPLSLFISSDCKIIEHTEAFAKSVPSIAKGCVFTETFKVVRPNGFAELLALSDTNYFVVIEDVQTANRFKCTKSSSKDGTFVLACTPMLNETNSPQHYNLSVSDFAPHDIIAEYLFVMKANEMGMREANELITTITSKNQELEQAREDLVKLNTTLEEKAAVTEENLKVAQTELLEGEKLAVLGKLAAGVAHEMNTPLGAINSSADNLSNILRSMFKEGLKNADHTTIMEACKLADDFTAHDTLTSRQERAERKLLTETLQNTYGLTGSTANEHASELVECGILSSDTEILDHVYGAENAEIALSITTTIMKIRKSVSTIEVASQKAANVIRALKSYVRNDNVHSATVFDVRRSINDILLLFSNQLKKGVELHVEMDEQLLLQANESELSKVWSNLIANALYAMNYSGNLWIKGRTDSLNVILEFINDGPTIPEDVMARLFEPFYTTKPIGEGSGMGLSIVFNIIASMNGSIEAESKERTTFTITLPKASR